MEKDAYIFTMHNHHKMEKLDHSLERYFPTLKKIGVRNFFSFLVVALLATGVLLTINQVKQQQETRGSAATLDTNCADATTVPVGALPTQPKPIWCYTGLVAAPTTRISGANSWVDEFNSGINFAHFNDGELDYRLFNSRTRGGGTPDGRAVKSQHWLHNNHWMVDMTGGVQGGALMRPNRSFKAENGKFVVEGDFAAGIPEFISPGGGTDIWGEIVITDAPNPTTPGGVYAGDVFEGHFVYRCILNPTLVLGCAYLNTEPYSTPEHPVENNYVWFQATNACGGSMPDQGIYNCPPGSTHYGGERGSIADADRPYWRACQRNQMDTFCRDRYRIEITATSATIYVNGILAMKDTGLQGINPRGRDMSMTNLLNKPELYVYMADWTSPFADPPVIRFHWGRLAVNPTNGPNAAPSFCLGEPQNTCPTMGHGGTPMPTSLVSSTPIPTMAQHTTPTPTTQPTQPPLTGSASMSLQPATQSVPASSAFTVMVHENSGTTPVNATQAVVTYPTALLRFDGFDTTTMQSAFPVMAQQTESGGTITIARGTTTPVSGNQHIVGLKFSARATTASTAAITLTSSSVLLSSQTNTNILSQRNNATVNITVAKTGDLNNDNKIDILDLSIFLNKWNSTDSASDMNHDGTVNILDLSVLLSQWGK